MWATGDFAVQHKPTDLATVWSRLTSDLGYVVVNPNRGFLPDDVCQGGVGDCWLMSAIAVVAERRDLIDRIFLFQPTMSSRGIYKVRLFIDCQWRQIAVDDYFALASEGGKGRKVGHGRRLTNVLEDGLSLKYCKANRKQLWVPIIEKA